MERIEEFKVTVGKVGPRARRRTTTTPSTRESPVSLSASKNKTEQFNSRSTKSPSTIDYFLKHPILNHVQYNMALTYSRSCKKGFLDKL